MVSDKLFWWGTGILIVGLSAGFIHIIYLDILHKQKMVSGIIEEMLIPEFINKRPFREIDHLKREKILKDILKSVNSNVSCRMGTDNLDYRDYYKNTASLLKTYNCRISRFEEKYLEHYKDMPVEEIRGWDKVMLVAKNLQDDDLNFAYDNVAPPDLINKYSTRKPIIAPKDSGTLMEEIVSKNNSYEIA